MGEDEVEPDDPTVDEDGDRTCRLDALKAVSRLPMLSSSSSSLFSRTEASLSSASTLAGKGLARKLRRLWRPPLASGGWEGGGEKMRIEGGGWSFSGLR